MATLKRMSILLAMEERQFIHLVEVFHVALKTHFRLLVKVSQTHFQIKRLILFKICLAICFKALKVYIIKTMCLNKKSIY